MPRTTETIESRILSHFRTAPLPEAQLLFGLVQGEMRARAPQPRKGAKSLKAGRRQSTPAVNGTIGDPVDSIGE